MRQEEQRESIYRAGYALAAALRAPYERAERESVARAIDGAFDAIWGNLPFNLAGHFGEGWDDGWTGRASRFARSSDSYRPT